MRTLAESMRNSDAATLMRDLAIDYDKLAARAEERAKKPGPAPSPIRE
jgi:hypothetical protein